MHWAEGDDAAARPRRSLSCFVLNRVVLPWTAIGHGGSCRLRCTAVAVAVAVAVVVGCLDCCAKHLMRSEMHAMPFMTEPPANRKQRADVSGAPGRKHHEPQRCRHTPACCVGIGFARMRSRCRRHCEERRRQYSFRRAAMARHLSQYQTCRRSRAARSLLLAQMLGSGAFTRAAQRR